jgi:hypothetical protein
VAQHQQAIRNPKNVAQGGARSMPWMSHHIRAGWLALCLIAQARGQYRFDAWTADNGLPQNIIRDVCQTRDGYLWVATLNGLARFDGVHFTVFDHTNSPGIESNRFTSLFQDIDGDLWLGTESSGVAHYHLGVFTTYTTIQGLPYNAVSGTTGDASGHLWVLSHDRIMEWKPGSARFVDVTPKTFRRFLSTLTTGKAAVFGRRIKRACIASMAAALSPIASRRGCRVIPFGEWRANRTARYGWKHSME